MRHIESIECALRVLVFLSLSSSLVPFIWFSFTFRCIDECACLRYDSECFMFPHFFSVQCAYTTFQNVRRFILILARRTDVVVSVYPNIRNGIASLANSSFHLISFRGNELNKETITNKSSTGLPFDQNYQQTWRYIQTNNFA